MIRILIVDDELPARAKIRSYLEKMDITAVIHDVHDPMQALESIQKDHYDLVFLDIQMPKLTGIELLEQIDLDNCPAIIFSTAFNDFAIKAFELHALDYLLKPYDFNRFQDSTTHALKSINQDSQSTNMLNLLKHWKSSQENRSTTIWISHQGKIIPIQIEQIELIEASGNYVILYVGKNKYLMKSSLSDMLNKLDPTAFVRVHRSYIVNQKFIVEMVPKSHGDLYAVLKNGQKIVVSRHYRDQLL